MLARLAKLTSPALFLAAFAFLLSGARTAGIARDEAYYFRAGELYSRFPTELVRSHSVRAAVQASFSYNAEHPALMKLAYGASHRLLHDLFHVDEILSFRMPALLLAAWLCVLLYRLGVQLGRPDAGALAAGLALAQPHFFYHAELACFDAPVATLWLATVYAYLRALESISTEKGHKWSLLCGLLFGLSQGVKFNTLFLPPVLLAHWIYVRLRGGRPSAGPFIAMATLGPLVFFVCWPWMWFDTFARLSAYLGFHLHHWHYNFEFLGRNYNHPPYPLAFPWVETALTVPLVTLALALLALVLLALRKPLIGKATFGPDGHPIALLVVNAAAPLLILNLPDAPIFGGVKHFLAAMPFLALLAALAAMALARAAATHLRPALRPLVPVALAAVAFVPAAIETAYAHPDGISYYNQLAGGFAGGADLGMNRQFWGASPRALFPWMNAQLPRGMRIYFHDLNGDAYQYYTRAGLLRSDLAYTGLEEPAIRTSDLAMVIHERHFNYYEYWIWQLYGTLRPIKVLAREGVPLVTLYERPSLAKKVR